MSFSIQKTPHISRNSSELNSSSLNPSSLDDEDLFTSQLAKRKLDALNVSPVKTHTNTKRRKKGDDTWLGVRVVNTQSTENFITMNLIFLLSHANNNGVVIEYLKTISKENKQYLLRSLLFLINEALEKKNVSLFADTMNFIIESKINVFEELEFQKLLRTLFKEKTDKNVDSFNDLKVVLVDPNAPRYKSSIHCSSNVLRLNAHQLQIRNNKVTINGSFEHCSKSLINLIKMFYGFHQKISSEEEYRSLLMMANQLGADHLTSKIMRSMPENLKNQHLIWMEFVFKYGTASDFQWIFSNHVPEGFEDILDLHMYFNNIPNIADWFNNTCEIEKWISVLAYCNQTSQLSHVLKVFKDNGQPFELTNTCYQMFLMNYNDVSSSDIVIRVGNHVFFIDQNIISLTNPTLMNLLKTKECTCYEHHIQNSEGFEDTLYYQEYDLTGMLLSPDYADLVLRLSYCPYERMSHLKEIVDASLEEMSPFEVSHFLWMINEFDLGNDILERVSSLNPVNVQNSSFHHSDSMEEESSIHATAPFLPSQNADHSVSDIIPGLNLSFVPDSQE